MAIFLLHGRFEAYDQVREGRLERSAVDEHFGAFSSLQQTRDGIRTSEAQCPDHPDVEVHQFACHST